jgi:hypothetical protein
VIDVGELEVEAVDSQLSVTLTYAIYATGETRTDTFVRSAS